MVINQILHDVVYKLETLINTLSEIMDNVLKADGTAPPIHLKYLLKSKPKRMGINPWLGPYLRRICQNLNEIEMRDRSTYPSIPLDLIISDLVQDKLY